MQNNGFCPFHEGPCNIRCALHFGDQCAFVVLAGALCDIPEEIAGVERSIEGTIAHNQATNNPVQTYNVIFREKEGGPGVLTLDRLDRDDWIRLLEIALKGSNPPVCSIGLDGDVADESTRA